MAEPTLAEYLLLARASALNDLHFKAVMAEDNDDYLEVVKRALNLAIGEIVANRRHKIGHSEDALNTELTSLMRFAGVPAYHDVKYGGHTDISVRLGTDFLWIAEAKLWRGSSWAFSGLAQIGRYMSGMPGQTNGSLILYVTDQDAAGVLDTWKAKLTSYATRPVIVKDRDKLRFITQHKHIGAGTDVFVEHQAVPLFWSSKTVTV